MRRGGEGRASKLVTNASVTGPGCDDTATAGLSSCRRAAQASALLAPTSEGDR